MAYETILTSRKDRVAIITINRPDALNALNTTVAKEMLGALKEFDADPKIGAIIITGSEKAFAAGADIKEMSTRDFAENFEQNHFAEWDDFLRVRKPVIAAVSGYALGGGCELAMMCDFIIASDTAKFGQPEITLGVMPGMGGSQRLTLAVGKAKAMDMCLTGRMMDAEEAERAGLVSRIVPKDDLMEETLKTAAKIGEMPRLASYAVKESVNRAFEMGLSESLLFERRLFHSLFSTEDQKEGMDAFAGKRTPQFKNR